MKRLIIKSLEYIAIAAMVIIIVTSAISGATAGGFIGFLAGVVGGGILSVVMLGTLFLLMDIADNTRRTAILLEQQKSFESEV